MASAKEYGYFIKGQKLALIEKDTALDNDVNSRDYGPDVTNVRFKSPQSSVTKGIELEYVRTPNYTLTTTGTEGTDFHRFIGWGSDGTNLLLFTYGVAAVADLSSLFAADDYIVISGSSRWNGLHQVKSTGGATGMLTLKTKCNLKPSAISVVVDFTAKTSTASGYLSGDTAAATMDIEAFKDLSSTIANPYLFINSAADTASTGIFSVSYPDTSGQIDFGNKITIDADGDYTSTEEAIEAENADTVDIFNIFYEQISVYEGVNVLNDESDELPISEYLSKAVVYYLKAKMAEDIGNFQLKDVMMREFYRIVEKSDNAKIHTIRRVAPSSAAIR